MALHNNLYPIMVLLNWEPFGVLYNFSSQNPIVKSCKMYKTKFSLSTPGNFAITKISSAFHACLTIKLKYV